jgi:hypothetical protein
MIYNLKFSCGHEGKVSLKGNKLERETKANLIQATEVCQKCKEK